MERVVLAAAGAFLLGVLVGSVAGGGAGLVGDPGPGAPEGVDSPGASLSKSVGACGDVDPDSGWVHDVAVGESFAVTLDATVVHDRGRPVTANVSRSASGTFRIDLRTQVHGSGASTDDAGSTCTATHLTLGTNLPTDYEAFAVSVNGRTLLTVEYDGTTPDLHRLPNPINATAT